ncbi:MAG: hypothetical protein WDM96_10145 [Lacunisphaera sp.]
MKPNGGPSVDFPEFGAVPAPAAPASPPASWSPAEPSAPVPAFVPQFVLAGLGWRLAAAAIDGFLQFLCKLPLFLAIVQVFKIALQNRKPRPIPKS